MNANTDSSSDFGRGPFSATKLWNDIVQQMKSNVPAKRRRWRMKVFEDAFVASEALDWLHGFLKENPNFGADVTRQQAVQLCSKFLKNGIITDARGKQYNGIFEDNSHLYRFTDKARYSPYKTKRPPTNERPQAPKNGNETTRTAPAQKRRLNTIYQDEATEDWSVSNTVSILTPSYSSGYNLQSNPLNTIEPSRTPLVNRLNILSATRGDLRNSVKSTGGVKLRRRSTRRDSLKDVIMNPAAFVAHNRRSLSEKEISSVWWNIATIRLRRLMDLDESVIKTLKEDDYDISSVHRSSMIQEFPKAAEVLPQWLIPAMKCLIHWPNGDYSKQSFPKYAGFERDVFKAVVEFFDEEQRCPLVPKHLLLVFRKIVDYLFKCKLTAMRSLQYCCLMIPVKNRELLQVLLKFMVRLLDNHALSLSDDLPTKEKLIQSFSHAIFGVTADMDVIRLLYFMLEKFPEYFKNPEGLQFQVEQRLLFLRNCRNNKLTVPSQALPLVKSYCEKVTPQEFKEQSLITSQRSLKDLLDKIIEDESISVKERKRQLKQFEKTYPEIYRARLPGDNLSSCSTVSQRSEKLKQVMKPLIILKNLR